MGSQTFGKHSELKQRSKTSNLKAQHQLCKKVSVQTTLTHCSKSHAPAEKSVEGVFLARGFIELPAISRCPWVCWVNWAGGEASLSMCLCEMKAAEAVAVALCATATVWVSRLHQTTREQKKSAWLDMRLYFVMAGCRLHLSFSQGSQNSATFAALRLCTLHHREAVTW